MNESNVAGFFAYARERYQILLNRRAGKPKPWTRDPILQSYRFCNVFREDDTVTEWFRESGARTTTFSCMLMRLTNRIDTAQILLNEDLFAHWDEKLARKSLADKKPLTNAAYIVHTPYGFNKLNGLIEMLRPVWADQKAGRLDFKGYSLEGAHEQLMRYDCVGSFIAYEVVTDLNHTPVLGKAIDKMTWAAAGPGAARGLSRIIGGVPLDHFRYGRPAHQTHMLKLMEALLLHSKRPKVWPAQWPTWDMRTVEHTLCEFDKYQRVREGGRAKQLFNGKG